MAKDLKTQILTALGLNDTNVKLEWQAKLTDGTIVVSTAPELEAGVDVGIMTEDGTTMPLPIGAYETEDGVGFTVEEDGIVAELLTEEDIAPTEEEDTVEVEAAKKDDEDYAEEADVADWQGMEKRIQNLEDAVASLKEDKDGGDDEVADEGEDMAAEDTEKPKKIKKTEEIEFLKEENLKLKKELGQTPAASKIEFNKFRRTQKAESKTLNRSELNKLSPLERFEYNVNKR